MKCDQESSLLALGQKKKKRHIAKEKERTASGNNEFE